MSQSHVVSVFKCSSCWDGRVMMVSSGLFLHRQAWWRVRRDYISWAHCVFGHSCCPAAGRQTCHLMSRRCKWCCQSLVDDCGTCEWGKILNLNFNNPALKPKTLGWSSAKGKTTIIVHSAWTSHGPVVGSIKLVEWDLSIILWSAVIMEEKRGGALALSAGVEDAVDSHG